MGAAIAQYAAIRLKVEGASNISVTTFGCPRLFSPDAASWVKDNGPPTKRIICALDPVPKFEMLGELYLIHEPEKSDQTINFTASVGRNLDAIGRITSDVDNQNWRAIATHVIENHVIPNYLQYCLEQIDAQLQLSGLWSGSSRRETQRESSTSSQLNTVDNEEGLSTAEKVGTGLAIGAAGLYLLNEALKDKPTKKKSQEDEGCAQS